MTVWIVISFTGLKSQNPAWKSELQRVGRLASGKDCQEAEEAGRVLRRQIPSSEREARAVLAYHMATCAAARSDDSSAVSLLRQADSLFAGQGGGSPEIFARSQADLARHLYRKGEDPVPVRKHLENALNAWISMPHPDSTEMASVVEFLGKNASRQAEYMLALEMLRQARDIRAKKFGPQSLEVGLTDRYLGNTYYTMDLHPEALEAYQRSLATIRKTDPGRLSSISSLLNNIAATQDQLERYQEAVDNYKAALNITRRLFGENDIHTIITVGNIGLVYHRMGNEEEAMNYMRSAVGMATKTLEPNDPNLGAILGDYAYVQVENGHFEPALEMLQRAISTFAPAAIARDWRSNPDIEDVLQHDLFRNAIAYKAHVLTLMADAAPRPEPLLRLAMDCYDLFAASLDQVWQEFSDPGDKLYLNKNGVNEYEKAIVCAARLWRATGDESWKAKIFEFMERGKCQVQLESLRRSRAYYLAEIPEPTRARAARLREEINELFYRQSLGQVDADQQLLTQKRIELEQFTDSLQQVFPGYAQMTGHKTLMPLALVQQRFTDPSTCILEYFLGDSMLYLVGVSKQGVSFRETALPRGFADSLQHFFHYMQYPHPTTEAMESYRSLGYQLYQLLLEPELKSLPPEVNRLRIIPDGLLSLLPFDALPSGPGPAKLRSHGELPLLIFDYRISYAGSAALLSGVKPSESQPAECLGFAWSNPGDKAIEGITRTIKGQKWRPLPGAAREMAEIRGLVRGKYFAGREATEKAFKENAADYGLLHLALHGYSGGDEPFIVFPENADSTEDGVLYLHELYNLPLQAHLAVLSACETGSGNLLRGEGVMSVASGFGSAGCPSVVMSVWPVDDQAGNRIMRSFYDGLLEGMEVDEALHQAKINFIRSGGSYRAAPYYWAPFFALGDIAPIPLSRQNSFPALWLGLGGGALLLALALFRRYRRKRG